MSWRLVTSNLLHGRSLNDGAVDTARMVSALTALRPDVLAMQEVDRMQQRSGGVDQTAVVAGALGKAAQSAVSWRFVPAIVGEPGGVWSAATGLDIASGHDLYGPGRLSTSYGTGLITIWPVRSWHVVVLTPFPWRAPVFIPGVNRWIFIDDEPRVCVAAVVEAPWGVCTVAATHLSFVPGWNVWQLRRLVRALASLPGPRILLGDFNLPAPIPAVVSRWQALASGHATFPSPSPRLQLDHVLLHDPNGRFPSVSASAAEELTFSDHRAIVVDLSAPSS